MSSKFGHVPVDDDTIILVSVEARLDEYDVLYQKWRWDETTVDSIIFTERTVQGLQEEEITNTVKLPLYVRKRMRNAHTPSQVQAMYS